MSSKARCQGILGWMFGHKFVKTLFACEKVVERNHCFRCGMPKGGWK